MKIFHYQENTGELIGEGVADHDPLEAGCWLVPAHATNVAPPENVEGSTRHFVAGGWEYREIPPPPPPPEPVPVLVPVPVPLTVPQNTEMTEATTTAVSIA